MELAAKAREKEKLNREIQRKQLAENSQRNHQTRAGVARERQEAQAKEAEGRAQRPGAQKGRGGGGRLAGGGRGRGRGPGKGGGGPAGAGGGADSIGQHPPKKANSLGNSPVKGDRCWAPWCGSKGEQRLEKWMRTPDQEVDCSTCGWKVEQNKG